MKTFRILAIFLCFIAVTGVAATTSAWTGPTASPPSNNSAAPLNVSTADQIKHGWIGLDSMSILNHLIISGAANSPNSIRYLNFGSTWDAAGYGIRDNVGTLEFKNAGGAWTSLQSTIYNYCAGGGCGSGSIAWTSVTGKPFNYSGQGGQPTWLWGTNDGTNYYVWNPSNFSVNYANSAGSAGTVPWSGVSGKPGNLAYWDTWYGSSYLGSNGDFYLGWRGQWLSTALQSIQYGGEFWAYSGGSSSMVGSGGYFGPGYYSGYFCPEGSFMIGWTGDYGPMELCEWIR